jgi:endonuclease/exonuclease/phosphatase family metal-dependent hydrolase
VRLVAWNIEKGKRWDQILACFDLKEIRTADIICLNEVDEGMARSQNKRIASELAAHLGLGFVFGPVYRELTKGIGEELHTPGENAIGIQGNAILTHLTILESQNILLPVCHNAMNDKEKREGGRCAQLVRLDCGKGRSLLVVNAHLEVLTTMSCRRSQMSFLLKQLNDTPTLLAGDWNTNTFDRGNAWRTFRSCLRLISSDVRRTVLDPVRYEPLFEELRSAGFLWEDFNDNLPTCIAELDTLEDRRFVPAPLRNYILSKIRRLPLRLDWIAGRGVRPIQRGRTIVDLPAMASDHLPVMCDFDL